MPYCRNVRDIFWYSFIVNKQPDRRDEKMIGKQPSKEEIKRVLADYCEDYPRWAVMACWDAMGPSELYDGIPSTLEDMESCGEFDEWE